MKLASVLFVLFTAACWGAYGPAIHEGQTGLKSSWKAFFLVGGAYFLIAVLVPGIFIASSESENFDFVGPDLNRGTSFGLLAGTLGACGALGVILAFKTGGSPIWVMPLVFGLAPLVNVAVSTALHPLKKSVSPLFWIGILLLVAGASLVLYTFNKARAS